MDQSKKQRRKINPNETANIFSRLTFFYTLPLFRKSLKTPLQEKYLYEVHTDYKSKKLGDRIEEEWKKQKKQKNPSIFLVMWKLYGVRYTFLGLTQLISVAVKIISPLAIGRLVSYFVPGQTELTKREACLYGVLIIGMNFIDCFYTHNYMIAIMGLAIQARTAICSLIFRKSLNLRTSQLQDTSVGKITNIITKDAGVLPFFVDLFNFAWIGFITNAIICYTLYQRIGLAVFIIVVIFSVLMAVQIYLGVQVLLLKLETSRKTDKRLHLTQNVLSTIRTIKMSIWEKYFEQKILLTRQEEVQVLHKMYFMFFLQLTTVILIQHVTLYLVMMACVWLGQDMTAETIFFVISCYQSMSWGLIVMPWGIYGAVQLGAAMKRIGNVLRSIDERTQVKENCTGEGPPKIQVQNVTISVKNKVILHGIDLDIDVGLTLIMGPSGSGKTMLMKAILKECEVEKGNVITRGSISYASQEPWLFPSSIRQNIIFSADYKEKSYQEILYGCALHHDLDQLENGDRTIIADRGTNLSKGQQARINLARAIYKKSEIILLDDPLVSLDPLVADFIFRQCILKSMTNKIVILITKNPSLIRYASAVVTLNGNMVTYRKNSPEEIGNNDNLKGVSPAEDFSINMNDANEKTKLIDEFVPEKKIFEETKESGAVTSHVYKKYMMHGGGSIFFITIVVVFMLGQLSISYKDKLVGDWVNLEGEILNHIMKNSTDNLQYQSLVDKKMYVLYIYTAIIAAIIATTFAKAFGLFTFCRKVSVNLHKHMITAVLNATMQFFDNNLIGNILNRCSIDLTTIDESIPFTKLHVIIIIFEIAGVLILIGSTNVSFIIPVAIGFGIFITLRRFYLKTGTNLKRLDASTRSPLVGHLNSALEGLVTIRAFNAEKILKNEFDKHQDLYTSASYTNMCCMRAFVFSADALCSVFMATVVIRFLTVDDVALAGTVGLVISQVFMMSGTMHWALYKWTELETLMTSVERVVEYTEVDPETRQGLVVKDWPKRGEIKYHSVYLSFNNSNSYFLKNISFSVKPKEKIGVVGRTGAGKSSIISVLFRLYKIEGKITIDGVDIKTLSLDFLRSNISVVPQEPVLITGTIRDNIDPIKKYKDEEIWHAIETVNLKSIIPSLDFEVTDADFSVGQKQLICLARILVGNNKIIILDEATENGDVDSDKLINDIVEKNFASCTVFKIAHKLSFVMTCDKILVLDNGEIVEYDRPSVLLQKQNGLFSKMVEKSGLNIETYIQL